MSGRLQEIRDANRRRNQDVLTEQAERDLGRSLTPAEMKEVASAARKVSELPLCLYGERR